MAEKYTHIRSLPEKQYLSGAPVILLSGALLREKTGERTLLRLKFRSLEEGILVGLLVQLRSLTPGGPALEHLITGFTALEGETVSRMVPIPEDGGWEITLLEAYYSNREDWKNPTNTSLSPLPRPATLEEVLQDEKLAAQFRLETNPTATYCPRTYGDLWLCTCGEINKSRKTHCIRCGMGWEELTRISSREVLEQRVRRYRKNRKIWIRNNQKRRKWSVAALLALAVISCILMYAGRAEKQKVEKTLAPYRSSAFADFQAMVTQSTGLIPGEEITFSAEYESQSIQGDNFEITATFTSQIGDVYSHMPVTITGQLGADTQEMTPGIPYTTDVEGNRLG